MIFWHEIPIMIVWHKIPGHIIFRSDFVRGIRFLLKIVYPERKGNDEYTHLLRFILVG